MSTPLPEFPDPSTTSHTFSFGGYANEEAGLAGVTFWPRAGARLIDYVLHYCVTYAAGFLFSILVIAASGGHLPPWVLAKYRHPGLLGIVPGVLGFVVYNVVCVSMHGSTLGKRLLGMVVVQENGTRCRMVPAIIRELSYFIDSLFFGLVGYLAMQKTYQEQRYGDQWGAHSSDKARERDSGTAAQRWSLCLGLDAGCHDRRGVEHDWIADFDQHLKVAPPGNGLRVLHPLRRRQLCLTLVYSLEIA